MATTTVAITPDRVHEILARHILTDGLPMVLDMERSQGVYLYDKRSGRRFLDFFGFFASSPLGMNHPKMLEDQAFLKRLREAALNKITNSDVYTEHMARFVLTFERVGIPEYLPYAFFIEGGALAVENALKAAFDWKVKKNFSKGYRIERGHQILHFDQAFHGRSGYTLSLTNTADPRKTAYFPKFNWPRVTNPKANVPLTDENLEKIEKHEQEAIRQIKTYFRMYPDDIAAIIIEPIQGEGGDNHFRPQFLEALRHLADENEALLIFDEVQTGVGATGTFWAHQGLGVRPDIISFGKKTQVCGILAGKRLDEVPDNVFHEPSRINSTWGGNIVDMVRFDKILEIIEEDRLVEHAAKVGAHLLNRLKELESLHPSVSNPRGRGLFCAIDMPTTQMREAVRQKAYEKGLVILGSGTHSIRFRSPLIITEAQIDEGIQILSDAIKEVEQAQGVC